MLCFSFVTCTKSNVINEQNDKYFGNCTIQKNGELNSYKAYGQLYNNKPDSLILTFEKWNGIILKEGISFIKIYKILGRQKINKTDFSNLKATSIFSTLPEDGDVLCDQYFVFERDSLINNITINSFNETTKEISGTFDVTLLVDLNRTICNLQRVDTVRIRNGIFNTKIF